VATELFAAFGLDLAQIIANVPQQTKDRKRVLSAVCAEQLADAAPTAAAIINEVARLGGRFVAMIADIYDRLSRHAATTTGTSTEFRLRRADVDIDLPISQSFIERVRSLLRSLQAVDIGSVDEPMLSAFLGIDGGGFYGDFPGGDSTQSGIRVADAVLHLNWIGDEIAERAAVDGSWSTVRDRLVRARMAADSLVATAESLVASHIAQLDALADATPDQAAGQLFTNGVVRLSGTLESELALFRSDGLIGSNASPFEIADYEDWMDVGVDRDLEPVERRGDNFRGTAVSSLALFVALWRMGRSPRTREHVVSKLDGTVSGTVAWLAETETACQAADRWLRDEVFVRTGSTDLTRLVDAMEEFLNLPLWRQRHLLYEIWVLCATLDACEQAGWQVELRGLERDGEVWVLSMHATDEPVAMLRDRSSADITAEVWREPSRSTPNGFLTPDVAVSTPAPSRRDLLVVEAKDRTKMTAGMKARPGSADERTPSPNIARDVGERYASQLAPIVTWVCNHCDFRDRDLDASVNHGTVWSRLHLADRFRPEEVPPEFAKSVQLALTPPGRSATSAVAPRVVGLTVVVDMTYSMRQHRPSALRLLDEAVVIYDGDVRGVAYSDHGTSEPFILQDLGPFSDLTSLLVAVEAVPEGPGRDVEEALEDAVRVCRVQIEASSPRNVLVLTDAPPHPVADCPAAIDFVSEMWELLASGSHIFVADDWHDPDDRTWDAFHPAPGFTLGRLADIVEALTIRPGMRAR
jgi:hypothetical protein